MAIPVKSNITSKACPEGMGSNCVEWSGGQLCSADLCKGNTTLTDVITALDNKICASGIANSPCYTGNWVDFTSTFPTSGSGLGGLTWTITTFGNSGENVPEYKWSSAGDLEVRGSFVFSHTGQTTEQQVLIIPLTTISKSCYPTNFTASQSILFETQTFTSNKMIGEILVGHLFLDFSTGILYMWLTITSPYPVSNSFGLSFGGSRFNLS